MIIEARDPRTGETVPVTRYRNGVLWCPFCDHSQQSGLWDRCRGCGAVWVDPEEDAFIATVGGKPESKVPSSADFVHVHEPNPEPQPEGVTVTDVEPGERIRWEETPMVEDEELIDLEEDEEPSQPEERQRRPNRHTGKLSV